LSKSTRTRGSCWTKAAAAAPTDRAEVNRMAGGAADFAPFVRFEYRRGARASNVGDALGTRPAT
jgi:hypothetical protein